LTITTNVREIAQELLQDVKSASDLTREEKTYRFLSQIERLLKEPTEIEYIYQMIPEITASGLFKGTPWEKPKGLIPRLVGGTLKAGSPTSNYELLSELRLLAIFEGRITDDELGPPEAEDFIEEVIVLNLDLIFGSLSESDRVEFSKGELKKIKNVFEFIIQRIEIDGVKKGIAEELKLITAQRPVFTEPIRSIIALVHEFIQLDLSHAPDRELEQFSDAIYGPTEESSRMTLDEFATFLKGASREEKLKQAEAFAESMKKTGLVCRAHIILLRNLAQEKDLEFLQTALDLKDFGAIELERHLDFVLTIINDYSNVFYAQGVLGLSNVLKNGLFSASSAQHALRHLLSIRLNPRVQRHLANSRNENVTENDAHSILIGGTLSLLGNPLGVGQGMNPTCQSARGLSLWSQFSPEKLINLIITAAVENNLRFRFEGDVLESDQLLKGLATTFDDSLDPVSVVLVPHLDKVYNEMMKRASYRGEDPHKWVNPAFYGHWIPNGFISAYNYLTQSIHLYENFVRTFYAAFHPSFNGGKQIIYPVPTGLFITNSRGEMLGFHAVSILRVDPDPDGVMRVYFLNPNNEGRQNWGNGVLPTVHGHGEKPGESSLPFDQFTARSYAIHFQTTGIEERKLKVKPEIVERVTQWSKESWGKKYIWT
jgi:hypothetical protein